MAKLLDPKQPVRFAPADQTSKPEGEQVAYRLKVPTVMDRAAFEREIALRNGRQHHPLAKLSALRAGVVAIFDGQESEAATETLAQIDDYAAELGGFYEQVRSGAFQGEEGQEAFAAAIERQGEFERALVEVADIVAEAYPPFARMRADDAVYPRIQGIAAAKLFLVGWEGIVTKCDRGLAGLSDASLARIPDHHLVEIGMEVRRLSRVTEDEGKNSASPSHGSSVGAPSTAESTPVRKAR